ncbi:phosphatase PAP2 family protein [Pseudochelatococcus lubricantis]|uniref:phosphatase PAP2 family protein n=1 Tax=Pseudochelatococcus lubricantis TaxID=1538102 RepID=UPI0035E718EA
MIVLTIILALIAIVVLRALTRKAAFFIAGMTPDVAPALAGSQALTRLRSLLSRFAGRYPALFALIARRVDPHRPTGLPLTLMLLAALYLFALFSGLAEDVLEAQGTIRSDNMINAALNPWRVEPLVSIFLWITNLGSTPAVVATVIIATGFLWPQRSTYIIVSLWVSCLGAVSTTTIGKLLIGRHRPEMMLDVNATGWSFPSGHATAAMAVYGFIAYAIARAMPDFRERFEVVYCTAVLIVLIGFSRMFLGVHYLTDVVGGFLVGGFWLLIGFGITEGNKRQLPSKPSAGKHD